MSRRDTTAPPPSAQQHWLRRFVWPDWPSRRAMLRREAWVVALAAYALLAFAYLWPEEWRNESPAYVAGAWAAMIVRVLQFHLGLLLLLIVAAALLRRHWRLGIVALPPMLFTLLPAAMQFVPRSAEASSPPVLRVMTVNLLMVNADKTGIIEEIRAARPDVLMLQEYTAEWDEAFQRALAADYPHGSVVMRDDSFGIALYARTPFAGEIDPGFRLGRAGVDQMRAEIDIGGRRIALYNIHLLPTRTLTYVGEHRLQFADLVDTLRAERLPYVVCGDFNFPETTPQHRATKRAGAREAHELAGFGRGATWPVNSVFRYLIPGIRIDHVYLGPQLTATRCVTGVGRGSDHRPVVVDLALRPVRKEPWEQNPGSSAQMIPP